jgi:PPOX class probable F420-dependent enzyme
MRKADLRIAPRADGTTQLSGPVIDQAALHGILARIRDLGLPLVLVRRRAVADTGHTVSNAITINGRIPMQLDLSQPKHTQVDERLRGEPTIWFGSVRPDGRPHLVPVWFLWDGMSLLVFCEPHAQKIHNIQANPHVTLALEAAKDGADIVILEGTAGLIPLEDATAQLPAYAAKYNALITAFDRNFDAMLAQYCQPIRVMPTRVIAW